MTNLQLKTRVAQICGLASSGAEGVEEWQLVQDVVNEGILDILSRTRLYVRATNIQLTAGVQEYELNAAILKLYDVYRGTSLMQEVSAGDIGETGSYSYTMVGFNRIKLGWIPDASDTAGLTVTAWYTPRPTPMSADGNDPSASPYGVVPPEFHDAIVVYACSKLADYSGDAGSGRGERYRIQYEGQDGMGGIGTKLGTIKMAVNRRASSGSDQRRRRRMGERITSDVDSQYWVG